MDIQLFRARIKDINVDVKATAARDCLPENLRSQYNVLELTE